jgi:asparagine synthase (glutamine-hydrolysing)
MCSIFGVIGKNLDALDAFKSLSHRGKDSSLHIQNKEYFFGSHRLAIESFGYPQNQPLQRDNYIALFNGEIYNYKKLITKYNLNAKDEIETILELFLLGKDLLKTLRGMFAIAIYNIATKELYLFRDSVGKKPLYFLQEEDRFIFASEPKAIYSMVGFRLDRVMLHQFLGYGATISPNTLDKRVCKLPPSSILHFANNKFDITPKELFLNNKISYSNIEDATKEYERVLKEAIELRVPKNIEFGVLLSGGLDSSLVSAIANRVTNKKLNLFTIGYDGFENYDEREYAKEVAKHLDANFFQFNFTKDDFFKTIDELLEFIDDPIGDPAQIPLFFLIKKAKEFGVKVLLSGDGSDELNFGYRVYKEYLMMEQVKQLPYSNWLKNHLRANFSMNKEWEWYKRALNGSVIFRSSSEIYTDRQLNMLLRLQAKDDKNFEAIADYYNEFKKSNRDILDWYSYADLKVLLGEFFLTKVDRVSMANGVEVRTPFLDSVLVELSFKIDSSIRYNPQNVKPIVKKIAQNYLPNTIINRKKKGLNYPFIEWILQNDGLETIFEANQKFRLFDSKHLEFLSAKASSGKFKQHLFPIYILSRFLLRELQK